MKTDVDYFLCISSDKTCTVKFQNWSCLTVTYVVYNCRTANGMFQRSEIYAVCFVDSDAVGKQDHRSYIRLVQQFIH